MQLDKYIKHSAKVSLEGLDWDLAAKAGLSSDEVKVLTYFADVEGQTVFYLREMLMTQAAMDPNVVGFLTMWNYEEFFHSEAIAKLLEVCGHPLEAERKSEVRISAQLSAKLEELAQTALSKLFPKSFPALYMAWGASQEILTLRGYEQIIERTSNPVLAELCRRIAKQERRHFAWYYNSARERLEESRIAQRLAREIFDRFWSPVGAGVKADDDVDDICRALFPGDSFAHVAKGIDDKLGKLPGFAGIDVVSRFAARAQPGAAMAHAQHAPAFAAA